MDFFKLGKGESAIVKVWHTSLDTIPLIKVHTVPNRVNGSTYNAVVKCNGDGCPLCAAFPKMEYVRVLTLYDFADGQTKVFKTTSRALMSGLDEALKEWGGTLNSLTFKISRDTNEFGSYGIAVVPPSKYAMNSNPEVEVDTDTSFRLGLFRSNSEMEEYLKTGVMPKHQKSNGGSVASNASNYFTPKTNVATKSEPVVSTPIVEEKVTVPTANIAKAVEVATNPSTFTADDSNFVLPF